jgi:hypothetical protein
MVAHDAVDPSVVKYLPPLPVWLGRLTGAAAQAIPLVAVEEAVSRYPSAPTESTAAVSFALATKISPLALNDVARRADPNAAAELAADVAEVAAELAEVKADDAEVLALDAEVAADVALVAALEAEVAALLAEV